MAKKLSKKTKDILRGLRRRKPTSPAPSKGGKRKRKSAKRKSAKRKSAKKRPKKKVVHKTTRGKKPRKGRRRKPFATQVKVGRAKATVVCPPNDTLVTTGIAKKNRSGSKTTEVRATCYRGRMLHAPKVKTG